MTRNPFMSTVWSQWKQTISRRLSEATSSTVSPGEIIVPPDTSLGDFTYGCFKLAKEQKKNPAELAKELAATFNNDQTDIESATAAGPYVNFKLAIGDSVHDVVREIEMSNGSFATSATGEGKQLILEYAQTNTHKEIHVGHLRNLVLGSSIDRILCHANWKVVPVRYHGDVGAHVAKCLWRLVKKLNYQINGLKLEDVSSVLEKIPLEQRNGMYLGKIYTEASRILKDEYSKYIEPSSAGMMDKPDEVEKEKIFKELREESQLKGTPFKDEVSEVQRKLEARDPAWNTLWEETRRWSLAEFEQIFNLLHIRFAKQYLESEVVDRGQQMVDELIVKKVAQPSQGAIIVDLEDKKLGVFLIRKSDGTSLYATKDLALAELKLKEYPKADRSLILVDNRQTLYFKQLFATLELMEIRPVPEFLGHEFVTLKTGAMSSREGNIVTFESFYDEVTNYARGEILKRHEDWDKDQVEHTTWAIVMGGIKFNMLKQDSDKIIIFDLQQALSFEGATGPYCQYAAIRLNSILKKAEANHKVQSIKTEAGLTRKFDHPSEKVLALTLAVLPERVEQAARELRPAIIAQWCFDTAQAINGFYRDVPVLESEGELREGRLRLASAARETLAIGLDLLGIPLPDEM